MPSFLSLTLLPDSIVTGTKNSLSSVSPFTHLFIPLLTHPFIHSLIHLVTY